MPAWRTIRHRLQMSARHSANLEHVSETGGKLIERLDAVATGNFVARRMP
jgi:hypothetical protein